MYHSFKHRFQQTRTSSVLEHEQNSMFSKPRKTLYQHTTGTRRNDLGPGSPETWTCSMHSKDSFTVTLAGTKVFKSLNAFDTCADIIDEIAPGGPLNFPREMCPTCHGNRAPECLRVKAVTSWKTRSTKCVVSNDCNTESFEVDHKCKGGTNSRKSREKASKEGNFATFSLKPKMNWMCYDYSSDGTMNSCASLINIIRPSKDETIRTDLENKVSDPTISNCLELKLSSDKKSCVISRKRTVGQRTPYCENFEHPCENEHEEVNLQTGLCANGMKAKCVRGIRVSYESLASLTSSKTNLFFFFTLCSLTDSCHQLKKKRSNTRTVITLKHRYLWIIFRAKHTKM